VSQKDLLATVIRPRMAGWGITRLADVTGLDYLGIPLAAAVRPLGEPTRLVAAGPTLAHAATSAALTVARLWHASTSVPEPIARGAPADFLTGYRIEDLDLPLDCLVTRSTKLDWVQAQSLADGRLTVVPRDLVCLSRPSRRRWRPAFLTATAVGLGAGATRDDAILSALCEWAAHDASAVLAHGAIMGILDIRTIPDAWCARTVQQVADADGQAVIAALPSRTGMPCWAAIFRGGDVITVGIAARPDPVAALAAALCDAAAARLAALAGTGGHVNSAHLGLTGWDERPLPWRDLVPGTGQARGGAPASVAAVTRLACTATGAAPLVVDLADDGDEGIAVVKVLCPDPARRARP
jgi:ribosomal protein S12 methylthiotransferase accessory factor